MFAMMGEDWDCMSFAFSFFFLLLGQGVETGFISLTILAVLELSL